MLAAANQSVAANPSLTPAQIGGAAAAVQTSLAVAVANYQQYGPQAPVTLVSTEPQVGSGSQTGIPTGVVPNPAIIPPNSTAAPTTIPLAPGTAVQSYGAPYPGAAPTGVVTTTTVGTRAKTNHPTTATLGLDVITQTGPALGAASALVTAAGAPTPYAATVGTSPYAGAATIVDIVPGTYRARVTLEGYQPIETDPLVLLADTDYNLALELISKYGKLVVTVMHGTALVASGTVKVTMGTETSSVPILPNGVATFVQLDPGTWALEADAPEGKAFANVPVKAGHETDYTARLAATVLPPPPSGGGNMTPLLVAAAAAAAFVFLGEKDIERPQAQRVGGGHRGENEAARYVEQIKDEVSRGVISEEQGYRDLARRVGSLRASTAFGRRVPSDQVIDARRIVKHGNEWWLENAHGPYSGPYKSERAAEKAKADLRRGVGKPQSAGELVRLADGTQGTLERTLDGGYFLRREHGSEPSDRVWLASRSDRSPLYAGPYDSECSWCYLGPGHTEAAHAQAMERRSAADLEIGSATAAHRRRKARPMDLGGTFFDRDRQRHRVTEDDIIEGARCEVCGDRLKAGEDVFVYDIGGGVSYAHRRHAGEMRRELHAEQRRSR